MSDQPDDETPKNLDDLLKKAFGSDQSAASFFEALEPDPATEAWIGFHTVFMGLQSAGFQLYEATDIMSGYLYRLGAGTAGPDGGLS